MRHLAAATRFFSKEILFFSSSAAALAEAALVRLRLLAFRWGFVVAAVVSGGVGGALACRLSVRLRLPAASSAALVASGVDCPQMEEPDLGGVIRPYCTSCEGLCSGTFG